MCFGAQKNRLLDTVFWVPTTYVLVEIFSFALLSGGLLYGRGNILILGNITYVIEYM